jgi:uncharacterized damage-inducible protein DinB
MDSAELRRLFDYNRWATLRLLDAAGYLSHEELTRDLRNSFPSVLATLVHGLGAEWVWLERWNGRSPTAFPDAAPLDSISALGARWDALWSDQQRFISALRDADVSREIRYKLFNGAEDARPLGDLVRHVINHATYHRGQVVTMLRQLGKTPPSTDFIRFVREVG